MTVVLANGYAGTLFSFMSVTKLEQPINSLEELAFSKDVTLLTQSDTELTNRFLVRLFIDSELINLLTMLFKNLFYRTLLMVRLNSLVIHWELAQEIFS